MTDNGHIKLVFDTATSGMKRSFQRGDVATSEKWGRVVRLISEEWPEEAAPLLKSVEHVVLKMRA
jgi:hypothetical protein